VLGAGRICLHPVSTIHCYQSTLPSIGSDILSDKNEEENNDDDSPSLLRCPRYNEEGPIWDSIS